MMMQHRERRDHEDDVREHVQDLVDHAAAVAGREADEHARSRRRSPPPSDADEEAARRPWTNCA